MDTKKKVKFENFEDWKQLLKEYEAWMDAHQTEEEREAWKFLAKEYEAWMNVHPEKTYCPASLLEFSQILDELEQHKATSSSLPMESI